MTAVPSIPLQVACCERVPRARVCPLDALTLTHAYAWRPCLLGLLTHTPDPPAGIALSGHCRALRVEISRARYRNHFKTLVRQRDASDTDLMSGISVLRPAHTNYTVAVSLPESSNNDVRFGAFLITGIISYTAIAGSHGNNTSSS